MEYIEKISEKIGDITVNGGSQVMILQTVRMLLMLGSKILK